MKMTPRREDARTVYSTELGRVCPDCGQPAERCACRKKPAAAPGDGNVRVRLEKKGRGGKAVSLVSGLPLVEEDLRKLAAELKKRCGAGGAVKDGQIEIQGDHRDALVTALLALGYRAKKAGG
ncbi:MAG: translation initiation factor Sui1 [Chloroflexi bacterium]|nr:translation initiation factor Sui1 [Chloroflexota bacterium]